MNSIHYPLSSNQLDVWNDQKIYSGSPIYNIGGVTIIHGEINVKLLKQAISLLISETETSNYLFKESDGEVFQFKGSQAVKELEVIDFSNQEIAKEDIHQWLNDVFRTSFNLDGSEYLYHHALLKESESCYYLMGKYHHLIYDGLSSKLASDRTSQLYNALLENREPSPKVETSYVDFINFEKEYLNSSAYQRDNEYWQKLLPELKAPLIERSYSLDKTYRNTQQLAQANIFRFTLKAEFYQQMQDFSGLYKSSSYHLLLVVVSLYFSRIYQRDDILIGIPSLNRNSARFKNIVGLFSSLSPLLIDVNKSWTFIDLLQHCLTSLHKSYRHKRFPMGQISKRLELLRYKRDSLFDIVVSYEPQEYSSHYGGSKVSGYQLFNGLARYPLAITICEFQQGSDVEIVLEGAQTSFKKADLEFLAKRLKLLLSAVLTSPTAKINGFNLLAKDDETLIYKQFNQLNTLYNNAKDNNSSNDNSVKKTVEKPNFLERFKQQVLTQPDNIALEFEQQQFSYTQLDESSNQLANYLLASLDIKPDSVIALYFPRCSEMIIAMLAILKTGAAYLPIGFDLPLKRIKSTLENSQAIIVLSLAEFKSRFDYLQQQCFALDLISEELKRCRKARPKINIKSNQLAYIIYTSGSTGQAKGVMIEHHALAHRLANLQDLFNLTSCDRVGQNIAYNFDPSIIEIFLPLSQGACLVLAPQHCHGEQQLSEFVVDNNITILALVPSSLEALMLGLRTQTKHCLRAVCSGGETLSPNIAKGFISQTDVSLFNVYGPTEATILASSYRLLTGNNQSLFEHSLTIGTPLNGTQIYIVDSNQKLLPIGVIGEIVIAGAGLARGYVNDKRLTDKKFCSRSFPGLRIYKTGDRGYIGSDGLLYFSGRIDRQFKISGFRIEALEIESILAHHKLVNRSFVQVVDTQSHKILLAYVETRKTNTESLIIELAESLRQQLPVYMQPAAIIPLAIFPSLSTGKIDLDALPKYLEKHTSAYAPAETDMEKQLLQLWQDILKIKRIGIHDNFFALGGDSLAAISLIAKLDEYTGIKQSLSLLLEHPSIFQLAKKLTITFSLDNLPTLTSLNDYNTQSPCLFLMASGHGDTLRFRKLAEELGEHCNLHMLEPSSVVAVECTIESLAKSYAQLIIEKDQGGLIYIGGFSIAGVTALATARILAQQGKTVKGVVLLDTIYPRWPLKTDFLFRTLAILAKVFFFNKIIINGRYLDAMLADPGIKVQLKALMHHEVKAYEGSVALFISSKTWPKGWLFSPWVKLLGCQLQQFSIKGLHGSIFQQPYIHGLALTLLKYVK